MKKILNISFIIIIILSINGCKKSTDLETNTITKNVTVTLEEYNQIEIGMNYSEVKKIVDGDCLEVEENNNEITYSCSGEMANSYALFTFENNKLISKEQYGLE